MIKRLLNSIPYITFSQRIGILTLSILIFSLQIGYFIFLKIRYSDFIEVKDSDIEWVNQQFILDSLNQLKNKDNINLYTFNPNFISDYKGYRLGMSVEEIDKLHQYRSQDKYVNSVKEFQEVTGVSDELLAEMSPFFKFPDWSSNKTNKNKNKNNNYNISNKNTSITEKIVVKDINLADKEGLMELRGIGNAFSERILKERNKLGGFVSMKQLNYIWGLSEECLESLNKYFDILQSPEITKYNINEVSVVELTNIPYLNYYVARNIVIYRSNNGDFENLDELKNIKDFPLDKLEIISLYLKL